MWASRGQTAGPALPKPSLTYQCTRPGRAAVRSHWSRAGQRLGPQRASDIRWAPLWPPVRMVNPAPHSPGNGTTSPHTALGNGTTSPHTALGDGTTSPHKALGDGITLAHSALGTRPPQPHTALGDGITLANSALGTGSP